MDSSVTRIVGKRRRPMRILAMAVPFAMAVALTACSGTGSASSAGSGTYTVGVVVSKTGAFSTSGYEAQQGSAVAQKVFGNEEIHGKKLKFVYVDDGSATDVSFQACTRLVTQDHVDAIVSNQLAANTAACLQATSSAGIPVVNATQNPGNLCASNLYTTGPVNNQIITPLVQYLLSNGARKFYLIGSDSAAPHTGLPMIKNLAQKGNASVVGSEYVPTGTSDYSSLISRVASARPDTVLDMISDTSANQYYKLLMTDPRTRSLTKGGFTAPTSQIESVGSAANGYLTQSVYFPLINTAAAKKYSDLTTQMFGSKATFGTHQVGAYDAIAALVQAAKNAKSVSSADVLASFANVNVPVPQGTLQFSAKDGHFAAQPDVIGQFQSNGAVKVLQVTKNIDPTGVCKA